MNCMLIITTGKIQGHFDAAIDISPAFNIIDHCIPKK